MILFVTEMPPNADGHGGSQRAMRLLDGLCGIGPVDLVLPSRTDGEDLARQVSAAARARARSCSIFEMPDWRYADQRWPTLTPRQVLIADMVRRLSHEAPRTGRRALQAMANALPARRYDLVFAGRLPSAVLAGQLMDAGLLHATRKMVDLDDVISRAGQRQLATDGPALGRLWRTAKRVQSRRSYQAETAVLRTWDAASVCTDDDAALLRRREPRARVVRIPNVVDRPRLAPSASTGPRLLFVGALDHRPNVHGLLVFLAEAWPRIVQAAPDARLRVVGMKPLAGLRETVEATGAELHTDVDDVQDFYRDCDLVVCPIYSGGGTKIKVLEAMAYGRPVVATPIAAEGLDIVPGRHALIAEGPEAFADACIRLCRDPALRRTLADAGRDLQQRAFGPKVFEDSLRDMVGATASGSVSSRRPPDGIA